MTTPTPADILETARRARRELASFDREHDGFLLSLPEQYDVPITVDLSAFPKTDSGNAERFVCLCGEDLRYCRPLGKWFVWDGTRWAHDETGQVLTLALRTIRAAEGQAVNGGETGDRKALVRWLLQSESRARLENMVALAAHHPKIAIIPGQLDRDPWLLNVENGTINLRTGELKPHDRKDLVTKLAPVEYDKEAWCDRWMLFLSEIMDNRIGLTEWLREFTGYCLTGDVSEQMLAFFYGLGDNGKSTFTRVIQHLLGDYAQTVSHQLLMLKYSGEEHPTAVASLMGCRLAVCSEVEQGKRLAEVLVKQLTGGDRIAARFMRQDYFQFDPTHKIILFGNHKPTIKGTDHAISRRIKMVPFDVQIPRDQQDPHLEEKLREELPGVLRWAVGGCLNWQQRGRLNYPQEIEEATAQYRDEMDVLGEFLHECTEPDPEETTMFSDLWGAYTAWCERNKDKPTSQRAFGQALQERGFTKGHGTTGSEKGRKAYQGIVLIHRVEG